MRHMRYNVLEKHLAKHFDVTPDALLSRSDADAAYGRKRAEQGFLERPGELLSDEVEKLKKGDGLRLLMLAFSPHTISGDDVCPHSTPGCRKHCVAFSGNGKYDAVTRARIARTRLMIDEPLAFLSLLVHLLDKEAAKSPLAVRLNGFSDIRWEKVLPEWFWTRYATVTFYDYTKHSSLSRPSTALPGNYTLTYSVTERTTAKQFQRELSTRNVAVVVETRGGTLRATGKYRDLPVIDHPTVDGDKNDRRFDDPKGSIVMLRRKGTLPIDDPLVVPVRRLEKMLVQ